MQGITLEMCDTNDVRDRKIRVMTMKYGYRFSAACLTLIGICLPPTAWGQTNTDTAPQTPPVHGHRAEGYHQSNPPVEMSPEQAELKRTSDEIRARERELDAEAVKLVARGKLDEALTLYEEESRLDDSDPVVAHTSLTPRLGIADIFFAQGRYAEAAAIYDALFAPPKGKPVWLRVFEEYRLKYVLVLDKAGRIEEAFKLYKQNLRDDPYLMTGISFVPPSIEVTDTNAGTQQLEAAAHMALGVHYYVSDPDMAVKEFQEVIRLKPRLAAPYFFVAEVLRHRLVQPAGGSEAVQAAFAKAAELGSGIVKRRAQQESGLLPPMDAAEINTLAAKEKVYVRERLQALGPPLEDSNTSVKPQ